MVVSDGPSDILSMLRLAAVDVLEPMSPPRHYEQEHYLILNLLRAIRTRSIPTAYLVAGSNGGFWLRDFAPCIRVQCSANGYGPQGF